jgi:hypothetical protein
MRGSSLRREKRVKRLMQLRPLRVNVGIPPAKTGLGDRVMPLRLLQIQWQKKRCTQLNSMCSA